MKRLDGCGTRLMFGLIILCFLGVSAAAGQESSYDRALDAYAKKDFSTAARYLQEYVGKTPDAAAYYLLGYSLYKLRKYPESAGYFREAYTLDPSISPSSMNAFLKKKS